MKWTEVYVDWFWWLACVGRRDERGLDFNQCCLNGCHARNGLGLRNALRFPVIIVVVLSLYFVGQYSFPMDEKRIPAVLTP